MHSISIGENIRFGWETFKKRPWLFIGALLIMGVANVVIGQVAKAVGADPVGSLAAFVINFGGNALVGMGTVAFYLKAHDATDSVSLNDLWHPRPFLKYLGTIVLYGIATMVAMIPFIIAIFLGVGALLAGGFSISTGEINGGLATAAVVLGLVGIVLAAYVTSLFVFSPFAVIDRELGPIEALKESLRITKGHRLMIIGFLIVIALLNILGLIFLIVGILVTAPTTSLALMHLYRTLSASAQSAPAVASPAI